MKKTIENAKKKLLGLYCGAAALLHDRSGEGHLVSVVIVVVVVLTLALIFRDKITGITTGLLDKVGAQASQF